MPSSFAQKLSQILSVRGTAAKLSKESGVPTSHLSKICAGAVLPSPATLNDLLPHLREDEASELVVEYLLLHRPPNARHVRILVSENDPLRDRLERAISYLDPVTRESLASIVEAVNRSPEKGAVALRGLGQLFEGMGVPARGRLALLPQGKDMAMSSEDTHPPAITEERREVVYGKSVTGARPSAGAVAAARAYEAAHPPPGPAGVPAPRHTGARRGGRKNAAPSQGDSPAGSV